MLWVWASILFFIGAGLALIIWRAELIRLQSMFLGSRLPAGYAVAEGVLLLILARPYFILARSGVFS